MSVHILCDVCGKERALNLKRKLAVMLDGKRLLLSLRVEADEGEKEPESIDIGLVCIKRMFADLLTEG